MEGLQCLAAVAAAAMLNNPNYCGKTALHSLAGNGHTETVRLLVGLGADINVKDNSGETALHCAAKNGNLSIVRMLVERGATLDKRGFTTAPLPQEVVRLIASMAANIDLRNDVGETALWQATQMYHHEIVGFLAAQSADVNAMRRCGATASAEVERSVGDADGVFETLCMLHDLGG